ncbi:CRS2-associated factor 1 [Hibiscus syriacus]|uniref:CRS2-associated factor 1 n=1 Tax=Hibiscus syriacus TaxID=106335 RepID=A0A6A3C4I8_HIBSY|nr:CRS2-associated factor 1 [Hibiscus syriacus]
MLNDIHNHWKFAETVRIKCLGVPTVDMKNVCRQLEDKTFGKIIQRHGGTCLSRLIKTTIDGLSIEETKEKKKRRLAVPALTKLAKNGYDSSLVPMVRDAFLVSELVRIDCTRLERSDYKKIGCKLRLCGVSLPLVPCIIELVYLFSNPTTSVFIQDLVPCILMAFDKEQVAVWRGKDYKPPEDGHSSPIGSFLMT